ncbi:MBL fold metallo-hydrolase [Fischerella thermalis CCMEE 5201]|nr:MBL fold metallo-hydrolase [Fischerella thermalis CCMEE 5201]
MMTVTEIAPDLYRISTYVPEIDIQFNQFLVRDSEPLLFHTGHRAMFPLIRDAVASIIDPASIRWLGFSHFEADECGALNEWLQVAPAAEPVCSMVGAIVSINDFATRPAKGMADGEVLHTGKYRFRLLHTPHVPHCWEAGLFFEEEHKTLLSSDLFHQNGNVEPLTESDIMERVRKTLVDYQSGLFANYMPYTQHTKQTLHRLAGLQPKTIAIMHGSTFIGDGECALRDLATVMREVLGLVSPII